MEFWTYQADPDNFLMELMLRESVKHDGIIALQPRKGEKPVAIGDVAYLCETDKHHRAGMFGVAMITSLPGPIDMPEWEQRFWVGRDNDPKRNDPHVWMQVLHVCERGLSRPEFRTNPILSRTAFANSYHGTMAALFREEAREIDRLIGYGGA